MLAIVVTHNPNIYILQRNLRYLSLYGINSLIIDNGSKKSKLDKIIEACSSKATRMILLSKNMGLGYAYNLGIKEAHKLHEKYALLLDQDSTFKQLDLKELITRLNLLPMQKIAGITINRKYSKFTKWFDYDKNFYITNSAVNSGLIVNISFASKNKFNEGLFLDLVDAEWCYRALNKKKTILAYRYQILNHRIGSKYLPKTKLLRFYVKITKKSIYTDYNKYRFYLIFRNSLFFILRGKTEIAPLKGLGHWLLNCYDKFGIIVTAKLLMLAFIHSIIWRPKEDNERISKLL